MNKKNEIKNLNKDKDKDKKYPPFVYTTIGNITYNFNGCAYT